MFKFSKKVKIIIITLGLLFSIVLCEIFLNISRLINTFFLLPRYEFSDVNEKNFVVFCLGDSYTYGIGAGLENSYPAQLQEILAKRIKDRPVKVFNFGVPGYNSSQVLHKLKQCISKSKPDVVVILCGGNDNWNFETLNLTFTPEIIKSLLVRSRTYKMFIVFIKNIQDNIAKLKANAKDDLSMKILKHENDFFKLTHYGNIYRNFERYAEAKLFYEKAIKIGKDDRVALIELGRCYKFNREYFKAIDILNYALMGDPDDKEVHSELKDTFIKFGMVEEEILFYEKFLEKFPKNILVTDNLVSAYIKAGGTCFLNNQMSMAKVYYQKALALNPQRSRQIHDSIKMIDDVSRLRGKYPKLNTEGDSENFFGYYFVNALFPRPIIERILFKNLVEMAKVCRKNDIKLFFSGYPNAKFLDETANATIKLASSYDISIIDHDAAFLNAFKKHPYEYYFVSRDDPHCTKAGYGIMAENIAWELLKFLKENKF